MRLSIDTAVFEKHPALIVAVIVATGMDNEGSSPAIAELLRKEEASVRTKLQPETFRDHPHIAALCAIHRSFGNNPNRYAPSVQALVKRVLKGDALPSINPLVDLYNLVSLRHTVCAGAEDLNACSGDIRLAFAEGTEQFRTIGAEADDPPEPGELVYKDDAGILCRKLNWRENDRTKITPQTKNAVIVFEGLPPMTEAGVRMAADEMAALAREFCVAQTRVEILTAGHPECLLLP